MIVIIPARYASQRLPGKPLLMIAGLPMICHVAMRAMQAQGVSRVIVATDDERIAEAVRLCGAEAMMTSPHHASGTDRVAEAAANLDCDVIVNVQGDEPLLEPENISQAATPLLEDPSLNFASLKAVIDNPAELFDPAVVKVVCDVHDYALYFSRSPIPFVRDMMLPDQLVAGVKFSDLPVFYKHIGIYVYRKFFLLKFAAMPKGKLESVEKLEQLRALEAGIKIKVPTTTHSTISVDTPEDLNRVRSIMEPKHNQDF